MKTGSSPQNITKGATVRSAVGWPIMGSMVSVLRCQFSDSPSTPTSTVSRFSTSASQFSANYQFQISRQIAWTGPWRTAMGPNGRPEPASLLRALCWRQIAADSGRFVGSLDSGAVVCLLRSICNTSANDRADGFWLVCWSRPLCLLIGIPARCNGDELVTSFSKNRSRRRRRSIVHSLSKRRSARALIGWIFPTHHTVIIPIGLLANGVLRVNELQLKRSVDADRGRRPIMLQCTRMLSHSLCSFQAIEPYLFPTPTYNNTWQHCTVHSAALLTGGEGSSGVGVCYRVHLYANEANQNVGSRFSRS